MKILFCNITYMNKYIGITNEDIPHKGGVWVEKNNDAHEQWNFLNDNGYCYGFVMNKGEQFAIERIDPTATKSDSIDNVTIVWCALNDKNKTVIVGWYENATVYRHFQESTVTPLFGIDRIYFTKAKAEDCYLLPEKDRTFVIERAAKEGKGRGFGQQNYWYAESSYAQTELIPAVTEFLETHKNERINRIYSDFDAPKSALIPLNESENEKANTLFYNSEYFDFLPYGYRSFYSTKSADDAFDIADALANLHQYNSALKWYKKAIDIDGENWSTTSYLPYLYQQCEMYDESIKSALKLLTYKEASDINIKHEIYSILADNHYHIGNLEEAIKYLDIILCESDDKNFISHTASVKANWQMLMAKN